VGIIGIMVQGFGTAIRKVRLAVYLWLANFVLGALLVAPLYFLFQKDFAHSLMGRKLFAGAGLLWVGDLVYRYQNLGPVFLGWFLVIAIVYLAVRIFLNGGVIGRLAAGHGPITLRNFFENGGAYFWRLARVFLVTIVGYLLVLGLVGRLISVPFGLWMKDASTQWTTLTASVLRLFVFLLLFSIIKLFFDYVKVILVSEERRSAIRTTVGNFRFVGRHFFKVWAIFLAVGVVFLAVTAVYLVVGRLLPRTGAGWGAVLFLWQQVYIFAAGWVGVLFFATEYHVWRSQQVVRA
jgi:hypothetical protein